MSRKRKHQEARMVIEPASTSPEVHVELHAGEPAQTSAPPKPDGPARSIGVGQTCPKCKSTNTLVRHTRAHPAVIEARIRHCLCLDCGEKFKA